MREIQSRVFATQPDSPVMFTTVCTGGATADATAVFEMLAKQWYTLLTDRREYGAFYAKQRIVTVPVAKDLGASENTLGSHGHLDPEVGEIVAAIKDIVNQIAGPVIDPTAKVSERGTYKLHEPTHLVHSRAASLLRLLPTSSTSASPDSDWRLSQLAARTGLSLESAAFYLDLIQFEHMLGGSHDLSLYTWVEHMQTPAATQALDSLLSSSTSPASIRYQMRGSKLLIAPTTAFAVQSATYTPPKRLGLGSWFHKKSTDQLPASLGMCTMNPIRASSRRQTLPWMNSAPVCANPCRRVT
ncbi:hypothetical protein BCR44DRAFT_1205271 [Catenaria anguillulae PL171]|uniref:Uncharacterized protein n=1 Tax=Catenaria anguillulae PL171 TaxID=765915 RepID=A0A1Y2HJE0_9FUNG|nr:hypothetical protein BCR44DRAFT_1205271 [Catenaria anguillulae PL171]